MVDESHHKDHAVADKIGDSIESVDIRPHRLQQFAADGAAGSSANWADEVTVCIELGRTCLSGDEISKLSEGSVVTLDSQTKEPVDVYVAGALVARGELQAMDDKFCVRVTEVLVAGAKSRAA
jgi:flagellar motor switch protein FliN/FliY